METNGLSICGRSRESRFERSVLARLTPKWMIKDLHHLRDVGQSLLALPLRQRFGTYIWFSSDSEPLTSPDGLLNIYLKGGCPWHFGKKRCKTNKVKGPRQSSRLRRW